MTTPPAQTPPDHDHQQCVSQALATARQLCLQRGMALTPIRLQVLELVWENHRAVKAYDLLERLKLLNSAAKPTTIYRALDFLIAQGLVHRVESMNAFIGCRCSSAQHEQILLICKRCQEVEEATPASVMAALSAELAQAGFVPHRKALEIHGVCRRCAEQEAAAQTSAQA